MMKHSPHNKLLIIIFCLVILVFVEYIFYINSNQNTLFVGSNPGWATYQDEKVSFDYPPRLDTDYIVETDWPPKVSVIDQVLPCNEAGEEIARGGRTEKIEVNKREYCRTRVADGAAGSVYVQNAYAREIERDTVVLTFSLKYIQCANYDGFQKTDCEEERRTFNMDQIIDRIFKSLKVL